MGECEGDGRRNAATEELILRTIAAHADSLLRTARRHSLCGDDAQDAYQRAVEIFMGHAHRLDGARAPGWLHVVVKREAQAIRRARQKSVASTDLDLDGQVACGPSPEERLLSFDMVSRSAEALKRLKPQELRALWLRAEGHSYNEIAAITGWSYTKVNRCLTEGRRGFLERYRGIESGAECDRWQPLLSAIVDGEATSEQLRDLRPHLRNCPGCRATLKSLRDSSLPIQALLPVPLVVGDAATTDHLPHLLMRLYESVAGGLHERAVHSFTKTQALVEASAAGKVAAVAASAAAVAGGGYASVERVIERPASAQPASAASAPAPRTATTTAASTTTVASRPVAPTAPTAPAASTPSAPTRNVFATKQASRSTRPAPEFRGRGGSTEPAASVRFASAASATTASTQKPSTATAAPKPAPEFRARQDAAPEFGGP
jgi:RNA polymerase sigma factor (sigma-70 family)